MDSICRLCLHKNDSKTMKDVFNFFPNLYNTNLTEILYWVFDLQINPDDQFSKLICQKCLNIIDAVGRYRLFFKTNQVFLQERRCPTDYEVASGWYNTRDVGTNTEIEDSKYVQISITDLALLKRPQTKEIKTSSISQKSKSSKNDQDLCRKDAHLVDIEWISVEPNILKLFDLDMNKSDDRIKIPTEIFKYYPAPQVKVLDLKIECLNQGFSKCGDRYYGVKNKIMVVPLVKLDLNNGLNKAYKKISKYTYKKLKTSRKFLQVKKKMLIQDYYYSIPTTAIRELLKPSSEKTDEPISIQSLVKTLAVNVHVCEFCSRVFQFKANLNIHYLRVHNKLLVDQTVSESTSESSYENEFNNIKNEKEDHNTILKSQPYGSHQVISHNGKYSSNMMEDVLNNEQFMLANKTYPKDYLNQVIFGDRSEQLPEVTDSHTKSNQLQDHTYAYLKRKKFAANPLIPFKRRQRKKMNADVVSILKNGFANIRKTRDRLENFKKIRFALLHEIENCKIYSRLSVLEGKLDIVQEPGPLG